MSLTVSEMDEGTIASIRKRRGLFGADTNAAVLKKAIALPNASRPA